MGKMHWSQPYLNYITLEITYNDESRQTWDYDCIQYDSLDYLKADMSADFADPDMNRTDIFIVAYRSGESLTANVELPAVKGEEFTKFVFDIIEGELNGN